MGCPSQNCGASCSSCGGCGGCGRELILTPGEIEILLRFAQIPFLPVARRVSDMVPVYLEEEGKTPDQYSEILAGLERKRLISLDYDLPLTNFNYSAYSAYPLHGSMALTARGQRVVELLERQGVEE